MNKNIVCSKYYGGAGKTAAQPTLKNVSNRGLKGKGSTQNELIKSQAPITVILPQM